MFAQATTAVPGGRLLHTALVNVLVTSDGRVFAGSVPLERLQAGRGSVTGELVRPSHWRSRPGG